MLTFRPSACRAALRRVRWGLAVALLVASALGAAEDPPFAWPKPVVDWYACAKAPGYDAATAGDPRFADKALWPGLSGKEAFVTQVWPAPKRVLVWAHPGESSSNLKGRGKQGPHDSLAPASWVDAAGKPVAEVVFDEETDVVFPSSDIAYSVNLAAGFLMQKGLRSVFRHMTIGRNCDVALGGDGPGRTWAGNLWVKQGGRTYGNGNGFFTGAQHSFVRNDNADERSRISQYFTMNKSSQDLSLEYCGHVTFTDEWKLMVGTVIIGPDSFCRPGRGSSPFVGKGATLALLDGAYWGKWINEWNHPVDLTVHPGGRVLGGLPERPLARDATIALSFRNWAGLSFTEWWPREPGQNYGHPSDTRVSAMFLAGSTIRSVPAPGSSARLVITRNLLDGHGGDENSDEARRGVTGIASLVNKDPRLRYWTDDRLRAHFHSQPFRTLLWADREVTIERVRFDHLPAGGFLYADEATRKSWTGLEFGPHNLATGDALFRQLATLKPSGLLGSADAKPAGK